MSNDTTDRLPNDPMSRLITLIEEANGRLKKVESELDLLRAEVASGFRAVERKIGVVSKNIVDMTADIRELQDRVEKLELNPS